MTTSTIVRSLAEWQTKTNPAAIQCIVKQLSRRNPKFNESHCDSVARMLSIDERGFRDIVGNLAREGDKAALSLLTAIRPPRQKADWQIVDLPAEERELNMEVETGGNILFVTRVELHRRQLRKNGDYLRWTTGLVIYVNREYEFTDWESEDYKNNAIRTAYIPSPSASPRSRRFAVDRMNKLNDLLCEQVKEKRQSGEALFIRCADLPKADEDTDAHTVTTIKDLSDSELAEIIKDRLYRTSPYKIGSVRDGGNKWKT